MEAERTQPDPSSTAGSEAIATSAAGLPYFTSGERAKICDLIDKLQKIARVQAAAVRDACPHPRPYYVEEQINFWGSVVQVGNWFRSVVGVLREDE